MTFDIVGYLHVATCGQAFRYPTLAILIALTAIDKRLVFDNFNETNLQVCCFRPWVQTSQSTRINFCAVSFFLMHKQFDIFRQAFTTHPGSGEQRLPYVISRTERFNLLPSKLTYDMYHHLDRQRLLSYVKASILSLSISTTRLDTLHSYNTALLRTSFRNVMGLVQHNQHLKF